MDLSQASPSSYRADVTAKLVCSRALNGLVTHGFGPTRPQRATYQDLLNEIVSTAQKSVHELQAGRLYVKIVHEFTVCYFFLACALPCSVFLCSASFCFSRNLSASLKDKNIDFIT